MSVKAEEHQFSIALTTSRGYLLQRQEVLLRPLQMHYPLETTVRERKY